MDERIWPLAGPRRLPSPLWRWVPVWKRNFLFWRKLALPSMLGNFGEPVLYLLALGYGLGALVGDIDGLPYIVYLASGIVCSSAMMSASFEAMYSAYTRMAVQDTWDAITTTPLDLRDVVIGEILWAATKALISATAILIVAAVLGIVNGWTALFALPCVFLAGLCFGAMAMIVTTVAPGYEFFLYYTTLVVTPMFLLGGVFFPVTEMPPPVLALSSALPLTHAVALVRPLITGGPVNDIAVHLLMLGAYALGAMVLSVRLAVRRLNN